MSASGWRVELSDLAKASLENIRENYPQTASEVVRNLFRLEEAPFRLSRETTFPDPPDHYCYNFAVGTLEFMVVFLFNVNEETLDVLNIIVLGYA